MSLSKSDVIDKVKNLLDVSPGSNGSSRRKCYDCVESLIEIIKQSLEKGEDVLMSGFGKFCVKEKKTRRGRNPETGEVMQIEARRVVTFKYSKKLRDRINGK